MARGFVAFSAFLVALWLFVWAWARMPAPLALTQAEHDAILQRLRGHDAPLADHALDGPVFVTVYDKGEPALSAIVEAPTLAAAVAKVGALTLTPDQRLKVDVFAARGRVATAPAPLFAVSLVPGVDGIGVTVAGRSAYLLPDELMRAALMTSWLPVTLLDFELGADIDKISQALAKKLALTDDDFARVKKRWFRFRVDSFVEPADANARATTPSLPVYRGKTPGPTLSRQALVDGANAGGKYLLRHLYEDGRFGYEYWPGRDEDLPFGLDYSLPRHAGGAFFLAQLYGFTHDDAFREGSLRALGFLDGEMPAHCHDRERACIADVATGYSDLGGTAMALIANAEYELASHDRSRVPLLRRLGNFVVFMQKPDGDFCHLYSPGSNERNKKAKMLYFSGEATLALAKLTKVLGPDDHDYPRYAKALDDGLHYLTDTQYAHLAGQFFFGEDHWTCLAADAGWDALPPAHREEYARFCDGFAAFLRQGQFSDGDSITRAQPDFAGAYSLGPFLPPYGTPVGSRTEAAISTYRMQERRGLAGSAQGRATREQIARGLQFLLGDQIRDDDAYLMANPDAARGGFLMSAVKRYVRIDFIQHNCSAMMRAADLF